MGETKKRNVDRTGREGEPVKLRKEDEDLAATRWNG